MPTVISSGTIGISANVASVHTGGSNPTSASEYYRKTGGGSTAVSPYVQSQYNKLTAVSTPVFSPPVSGGLTCSSYGPPSSICFTPPTPPLCLPARPCYGATYTPSSPGFWYTITSYTQTTQSVNGGVPTSGALKWSDWYGSTRNPNEW